MKLSPDEIVFWQHGNISINLTLVTTWILMLLLAVVSARVTRKIRLSAQVTRRQAIMEMIVLAIYAHIKDIGLKNPGRYIGFTGTLFLFIVVSNALAIVPGYHPPTGSLSTTTALALCVFFAVPYFGILNKGLKGYLRTYIQPNILMLPFNLIGEASRTLALAVRLFGNMMSGGVIAAILLSVTPIFFPVVMNALGLLTGVVQAYIFAILATVYIAAAVRDNEPEKNENK